MEFTKGEWKVSSDGHYFYITVPDKPNRPNKGIARIRDNNPEAFANARLIASAPKGHELAEFVAKVSATWINDGLLEMGEGDYIKMKQMALELLAKVEGGK